MITKVVYLGYQPLTEKVKEDFYIQDLIDNNVEINYWDLSGIFFKTIFFKNHFTDNFITKIDSFDKLKDLLYEQDINCTLFITNITLEYRVLELYRILNNFKCKTSFFARGALPNVDNKFNLLFLILTLKKSLKFNTWLCFVKNKYVLFLKKYGKIATFSIIFRAGKFGLKTIGVGNDIEENKSEIIDVNYFDYDKYLVLKNCVRLIDNNYCVYLDDYLPFHPDFNILNIQTIGYKTFYERLNTFFNFIESKYNIEVVIAAHPKADKYKEINYFEGRKVVFNKSAELTRHAEFVIGHNSSALSFAVLNVKPIILLYNNSIKQKLPNIYNEILGYSNVLGVNPLNIENEGLDVSLNQPDEQKYSDFKYQYLTSKVSENKLSSQIFVKTILSL
jgi:hypothetical protein